MPPPDPSPAGSAEEPGCDREADGLAAALLGLAAIPFAGLALLGHWSQVELGAAVALAVLALAMLLDRS